MTVQSAQPAQASQSPQSEQAAQPDIVYTWTDEAPMLATHSFLPIVRGFAQRAGVSVGTADISLAGRILAAFSLADDDLAHLGELTQSPAATIIKLPNISASLPQLKAAIAELQALGHEIPDYPDSPATPAEREARAAYDAVKGSAVNPVLREGNSDRRAPAAVKAYARSHPHSMGAWSPQSRTRVATMGAGDFRRNERSVVVPEAGTLQIRLRPANDGEPIVLRESLPVTAGEVVDATFMSAAALDEFLAGQVAAAKDEDLLLSVHLKATMMKVSDPIIFGHAVRAALPGVFSTYGQVLAEAGLRAEDGLASILAGLDPLPQGEEIRAAIEAELDAKAAEKGITIEYKDFNGQNDATTLNQIGTQVVADGYDAIIPIATLAAQCMTTAAESTKTPVIYAAISDPAAADLTDIDYVTGTSDALNTQSIMDMIFAVQPEAKTIGLLYSNSEANSTTPIAEAKAYLDAKGIAYVEKTGNTNDEIMTAANALVGQVDAVFTPTDNVVMAAAAAVSETLTNAGIPFYTGADSFVTAGAFATCGVNYTELGTYTADMALDILETGTVPEYHVMDGGIITVNTETAAALDLDYSAFNDLAGTVVEVETTAE